jgi:hypothetical protein
MTKFVFKQSAFLLVKNFETDFPKQALDFCVMEDLELARETTYSNGTTFEPLLYFRLTALNDQLAEKISDGLMVGERITAQLLDAEATCADGLDCETVLLKEIYVCADLESINEKHDNYAECEDDDLPNIPGKPFKSKWMVTALPKREHG